jgi:hypothetical protein
LVGLLEYSSNPAVRASFSLEAAFVDEFCRSMVVLNLPKAQAGKTPQAGRGNPRVSTVAVGPEGELAGSI